MENTDSQSENIQNGSRDIPAPAQLSGPVVSQQPAESGFTLSKQYRENQHPHMTGSSTNMSFPASGGRRIECRLCFDVFDEASIASLPCHDSLSGECCLNCAKQYFEDKIKTVEALSFTCPICAAPNTDRNIENVQIYFEQLTAVTIPRLGLSPKVLSLYHSKININWLQLHNDELIYCPNRICSNLFMSGKRSVPQCPKCKLRICIKCKKPWDDCQKTGGCEQFQILKEGSDPDSRDDVIAKCSLLNCPNCKKGFDLVRGGCDHMTCTTCKHEFCRGCLNPFTKNKDCPRYQDQKCNKGLHCHHPRNCWFYLRDEKTEDLQQLLKAGSIEYEENNMYFKRHDSENAEVLYKEYLVHEIRKHSLDPASMNCVASARLESILREEGLSIPSKGTLTEDRYRKKLRDAISQQLPLPKFTALKQCQENVQSEIAGATANTAPSGDRLIECKLCFHKFDEAGIASLPCHDSLSLGDCCIDCAKTHFEGKIKSGEALSFTCPICSAPNTDSDKGMLEIYFEQLTTVTVPRLKFSSKVMDLYHRKINIDWEAHRQERILGSHDVPKSQASVLQRLFESLSKK